jgi:mRNA interferase ChpB
MWQPILRYMRPKRCDQPRVLDIADRGGRKVNTLPQALLEEALGKAATLFA